MNTDVCECKKLGVCPFLGRIALHFRNKGVIATAVESELNRHVVRVEHSVSDDTLNTREGHSLLVHHHVVHGGVGKFCHRAIDHLRNIGVEVESEMLPT